MNSIRTNDVGQAVKLVVCDRVPPGFVDFPAVNQSSRERAKERKRRESRKERCIRWCRCAASADVTTKFLPVGPVSVGRIVSCPLPSRHPHVELLCADGYGPVNYRDPIPYISLREPLLGGRRRSVDRALLRELNECVSGLNFLGGVTSSGIWTSTPVPPRDSLNLLKRPEALEVGEGTLSKPLAGNVYDYLGCSSVSSCATGALAPSRKSHVSLPSSAVNAPGLEHICGDLALFFF